MSEIVPDGIGIWVCHWPLRSILQFDCWVGPLKRLVYPFLLQPTQVLLGTLPPPAQQPPPLLSTLCFPRCLLPPGLVWFVPFFDAEP